MKITVRGSGRLTANPEIKPTQSGGKVASFSIAIPAGKEETQFHECRAFNNTAEFIHKYFTKGKPIEIAGWLGQSIWTDKEQKERRKTYLYVSEAGFTLSESKTQQNSEQSKEDDDVPF